ncbi:hypothetical protein TNCT_468811 [Trichonephila clavata]|uniref:Uncharacterized protein n=1 Tax=Trichonephila clavata TaxID=2740835 RepID=A0A8X6LWZ7_TRICU|nr:hypothetical protein TNCT_468811 [Trichonephila clavata]
MPDFNAFHEFFFLDRWDPRREEEPMDWEDAPTLPKADVHLNCAPISLTALQSKHRTLLGNSPKRILRL